MRRFFSCSKKKDEKILGGGAVVLDACYEQLYLKSKESSRLRRSLSFSSSTMGLEEENPNISGGLGCSSSDSPKAPHYAGECRIHRHSLTPETYTRSRDDLTLAQRSHEAHEFDSAGSRGHLCSSGHSSCSSPVPLRCRPSRVAKFAAYEIEAIDLYIDGEQGAARHNQNWGHSSGALEGRSAKTNSVCSSRTPPRSSPTSQIFNEFSGKSSFGYKEQDTDEKLLKKAKEAEARYMLLSEENVELEKLRNKGLSANALLQMIQNITEDRKHLVLELSMQIKSHLAERFSAKEQYKQSRAELSARTRRLEKEKGELQSSLEKELERRSKNWSLKLGRLQSEERRLRERVRELAEQNVSLQREVSLLKSKQSEGESKIMNLEIALEEMGKDYHRLQELLSELQDHCKVVEEELDCVRKCCKEREDETKGLQEVVVRLHRICIEQEKMITGLRQAFGGELGRKSEEGGKIVSRMQQEIVRLTGAEQVLRREIESCRSEIRSLTCENTSLMEHLKASGNGCIFTSIVRLDQELRGRVDCLQTRGLSLLEDSSRFSMELLESIKCKKHENRRDDDTALEGYLLAEYSLKNGNLRRGIESLRISLQTASRVLDEKSSLESSESMLQTTEHGFPKKWKDRSSEVEVELKLKAEVMLNKMLREKLSAQESELEQLQAELASSTRGHDLLQNEIQRFRDELSCLLHKVKDTEAQLLKKDENVSQLREGLEESLNELSALRRMLKTVKEERDFMYEEAKQLRRTNMLMNDVLKSSRKKIESLDEDILLKEGQISILKDGLEKPLLEEFSLE